MRLTLPKPEDWPETTAELGVVGTFTLVVPWMQEYVKWALQDERSPAYMWGLSLERALRDFMEDLADLQRVEMAIKALTARRPRTGGRPPRGT